MRVSLPPPLWLLIKTTLSKALVWLLSGGTYLPREELLCRQVADPPVRASDHLVFQLWRFSDSS